MKNKSKYSSTKEDLEVIYEADERMISNTTSRNELIANLAERKVSLEKKNKNVRENDIVLRLSEMKHKHKDKIILANKIKLKNIKPNEFNVNEQLQRVIFQKRHFRG